jgi:hypothetical protein
VTVEPTNAFKAQLAEHIRTAVADPRARILVGARRRPQAVLMSVAADVPPSIRRILLAGSAAAEAAAACPDGGFAGVSPAAGAVLSWLWEHNHDEARTYLTELIAAVKAHAGASAAQAVARSLADALPADMPRAEVNHLIEDANRAAASHKQRPARGEQARRVGPRRHTPNHADKHKADPA